MYSGNLVVNKAREYLGVNYHHCGRSLNAVDCLGLIICVFNDLGAVLPNINHYGRRVNPRYLLAQVDKYFMTVTGPPQNGDILILMFNGVASHFAIVTPVGMIHSYEKAGRVVENRYANGWKNKLVKVVRYVG